MLGILLNRLLPLLTFSILLLIPIGAQNVFADHTAPFLGTTGHCDLTINPPGPMTPAPYVLCNLSGVNFPAIGSPNLATVEFTNSDLSNAILANLDLTGADFTGADLTNADLSITILLSVDFVGADLTNADLSGADLTDADLDGADLTNADLSGATLDCLNHPVCTNEDALVGGTLIDIDYTPLFVSALGTSSVITGIVGITLAGIAGPAVWFVYRRKNSENS